MLEISKTKAPNELIEYKNKGGKSYDEFENKDSIRKTLLKEQKGLCAYCMSRISINSMKIEHFKPQSKYPELALEFKNMLGCCKGNEGFEHKFQSCDTHKGNDEISENPSVHNDFLKMEVSYSSDGKIKSENEIFDKEMNEILNLNVFTLIENRKSIYRGIIKELVKNPGRRTKAEIQKMIDNAKTLTNGNLEPYCGVALYFLEKHLKGAE